MVKYDAIIVLGGGRFNDGDLTPLSIQRLDKGCKLYHDGISNKVFSLGGEFSTYNPNAIKFQKTGADLRAEYMIGKGVNSNNIVRVAEGRDTIGEAFASRKITKNLGLKNLLIVTSDKHLERALFIFRRIYGKEFLVNGEGVPCGDLLNEDEECEYLMAVKNFFVTLPEDIVDPINFENWYQEHKSLYDQYRDIHLRYVKDGKESNQAYLGVKER